MIEIVPYNSRWPEEFRVIGTELRRVLGELALRIDHVGSTAVPWLAAKDVIDVQLTVAELAPFDDVREAVEGLRYTMVAGFRQDHRPPDWFGRAEEWQKRFFNPPPQQRPTNLHVRAAGRANQRYALLFRDYLRANPSAASAYAAVKREIARHHPEDIHAYVAIKDPVCDVIMAGAEAWAAEIAWQPGPTDA